MTDTVQVAIIASIPPTIVGVLNYMQQRQVKSAVRLVKSQTDGIKDALVASTKLASHAEGVRDEKIRSAIESNVPINTVVSGPTEKDQK